MQAHYAPTFTRETGSTEADWLQALPRACGAHALEMGGRAATVQIGAGQLHLAWKTLPSRRIALLQLPRLAVSYRFEAVDEAARLRFMRHFDLNMLRGGG